MEMGERLGEASAMEDGVSLQEFWSFATNVLATTKKSSLLGIH